jgi:hypothetical protein
VARSSAIVAAGLGLAAAGALVAMSGRELPGQGPSAPELRSLAGEIDAALREAGAAVHSRATTIAEIPRLASAVATDAATVRDLRSEELAFKLKAGETIEIGRVFSDGRVEVFLRIPDDTTMTPPLDKPGMHVMRVGGALHVAEVVKIVPTQSADLLTGAIAVSQTVDLSKLGERVDATGVFVSASIGSTVIVEGTRPKAADARAENVSLESVGGTLTVVAQVLPSIAFRSRGMLAAAAAAALFGLGAALVLARRPVSAAAEPAANPSGGAGSQPHVVIQPGEGGTPPRVSRAEDVPTLEVQAIAGAKTEFPSGSGGSRATSQAGAALGSGATPGRFGRYNLVRTLGAGGMAEVYLARITGEAGFEKDVALKIMHKNLATDQKVVDLFLDEARLVSRLHHPNILQISDLGKSGDDYFIAMEFVDGWDLDRLVKAAAARGQGVPLRVALAVLRKICDGLHAAHTAHDADGKPLELVHRDVKAENVLCSRAGAVKVGDFGIAKANQQVHKTQIGELKGTAAYMAPEHRTGQDVDRRADVYGVGAIAYELLTGTEVNLDLAMLAHLGRQGWPHLKPPSTVRPELPAELDALVWKALAFDRADRFDSCDAFEEALADIVARYGLTASDKVVAQWVQETSMGIPSDASLEPVVAPAAAPR